VTAYDLLLQPFVEFAFMRRALVACLALGLSCGPLGTLLVLRRMSLMGDAMSHALLPGAAVAFIVVGLSLPAMSLGAFVAALAVAALAGGVTRWTAQREDASFAAFYLMALAAGRDADLAVRQQRGPDARALRQRAGGGRRRAAAGGRREHGHAAGAGHRLPAAAGGSASTPASCAPWAGAVPGTIRSSWCWWWPTWWPVSRPWAR
jgi:hypothetical protein